MNQTPLSSDASPAAPPAGHKGWLHHAVHSAVREPLLHFLLLGGLIFGIDTALSARRGDNQTIQVSADVVKEARALFAGGMKREPSPAELKVLLDRWVDNEVLYRDGLALGLDRGDTAIRDRVIFKSLSVTQNGLTLPPFDEATLKAWFDGRRDKYDVPARFDFLEAVVTSDRSPVALQKFVAELNAQQGEGQTESSLRAFKDRPRPTLVQSYGAAFADAMDKLSPGAWHLLDSQDGPRVVRLEAVTPGTAADYAALHDRVMQDWKDETMAQITTQAVRKAGQKYTVKIEEVQP